MEKIVKFFRKILRPIQKSERLVFFMSIIWILSSFMTWFSSKEIKWYDARIDIYYNAFTWICAILWYFFFIFLIILLFILMLKWNNPYLTDFLRRNKWIYLFLVWESLFVSICSLLIYSSYWFNSPYSEIWFWLYLAVASQVVWLFWAHYFFISKENR